MGLDGFALGANSLELGRGSFPRSGGSAWKEEAADGLFRVPVATLAGHRGHVSKWV